MLHGLLCSEHIVSALTTPLTQSHLCAPPPPPPLPPRVAQMHAREPLEDMARKPHWPLHTRTYETSKNTQLRDMTHKHDTRDFGTLHTRDLWGSRLGQTSFELGGGALPDLHRTTMHGRY